MGGFFSRRFNGRLPTDLVKIILFHVDPYTVRYLPRVCKQFQRIVDKEEFFSTKLYRDFPQIKFHDHHKYRYLVFSWVSHCFPDLYVNIFKGKRSFVLKTKYKCNFIIKACHLLNLSVEENIIRGPPVNYRGPVGDGFVRAVYYRITVPKHLRDVALPHINYKNTF